MDQKTRYAYEKRIRELELKFEKEESRRYDYQQACYAVHDAIIELAMKGEKVNQMWILNQFRRLWK